MAKHEHKTNPRLTQIFQDLEHYLEFCKNFGYRFDESDLYSNRSFAYRQYGKFLEGKSPKDMWAADSKSN